MSTSVEQHIEDLTSPKTFNARKAINGTTYPVDKVEVYADAEAAHAINILAADAAKARHLADTLYAKAYERALEIANGNATVESDPEAEAKAKAVAAPGYVSAASEATKLEAKLAAELAELDKTVLTFHLRGLAPKQWRLIHSLGRKEIKEPVRKHFEKGEDGDEDFQAEIVERNIARNAWINNSCIASAIIKVENRDGEVDTSVWSVEDVADIYDTYLESEYEKLKSTMESLTFANNLFQVAVQQDADFLPKR
jgi:hypothetical protein